MIDAYTRESIEGFPVIGGTFLVGVCCTLIFLFGGSDFLELIFMVWASSCITIVLDLIFEFKTIKENSKKRRGWGA